MFSFKCTNPTFFLSNQVVNMINILTWIPSHPGKVGEILDQVYPLLLVIRWILMLLVVIYTVDIIFLSPRRIKNIPNLYSAIPVWGNLSLISASAKTWQDSPCLKFLKITKSLGDVYQVRFGIRDVIIVNSYSSIMKLWCCKSVRGNNSRPIGDTFHKLLSKENIYTIGTTPFGPDYLNMRKFVTSHLLSLYHGKSYNGRVISQESDKLIARIIKESGKKKVDSNGKLTRSLIVNDLLLQCQYFHLAVALMLTYGYSINYSDEEARKNAKEIIYVENQITKVRSHVQNFQDFLPQPFRGLVERLSGKEKKANALYERRKKYLDSYFTYSKNNVTYPTVSVKKSLMYRYFMDGGENINRGQMASICLTLISAGLDNTPLNFLYEIHQLSNSPHICEKAYHELLKCYANDPVWACRDCYRELKCEYVVALVKETLRLFTVLPMALPRETTASIVYGNAVIPAKTILFMNCWAGNHDEEVFYKPMEFIPERFLNSKTKHLAFGIGARMCLGNHLAFQELYTLTCKFILLVEFQNPRTTLLNPLELNLYPGSIAIEPEPLTVELKLRSEELLSEIIGDRPETVDKSGDYKKFEPFVGKNETSRAHN